MDHLHPIIAVLVVEDEALIRIDVAMTIEEAGFKTYEAGDADQAVRLLERCADIAVLFTDVDIPGSMDGLALAHYASLRRNPPKVIVTSGKRKVEAADMPDAALFLSKPYHPCHVVEKLRETAP
jgi:two-component system, response regulator PdtaR